MCICSLLGKRRRRESDGFGLPPASRNRGESCPPGRLTSCSRVPVGTTLFPLTNASARLSMDTLEDACSVTVFQPARRSERNRRPHSCEHSCSLLSVSTQ